MIRSSGSSALPLSALPLVPAVILVFLAFSGAAAQSYWCPPELLPTQFRLTDVVYVEGTGVVAVGREVVARSTDGGRTWTEVSVPGEELTSVSFSGPDAGFAVGKNGVFLRTTDGGLSWERCGDVGVHLAAVSRSGTMTATAVAVNGNIYYTVDGGENWALHEASVSVELSDIDFLDQSVGMIVGYNTALRTEDGGASWRPTPVSEPALFTSVCVVDSLRCFAGGFYWPEPDPWAPPRGHVDRSEDGGLTWNRQFVGLGEVNAVDFADANHGLAVGGYRDIESWSLIKFTDDGGHTWSSVLYGINRTPVLQSVAYGQNDEAIAVDDYFTNVLLDRHCLALDLEATPDYGAVRLDWSIQGLGAYDGFRLFRADPDSTGTWIPGDGPFPDTTGFWFDEGLEAATEYTYTVIAFDGPNETARSDPVVVTTLEDPVLDLAASPGAGLVRLNWSIFPPGSADGIRLLRVNHDHSETWIPEDTAFEMQTSSYIDDDVVPGLEYRYSLVAYPRPGYRVQSQEVVASPFGSMDITDFRAVPSTDQIRLYWEVEPDLTGYINGIRLLREQTGSGHVWLPVDQPLYPSERSYIDQTVTPGSEYRYTLKVWLSPDGSVETDPLVVSSIAVPVVTSFRAELLSTGTGVRLEWDVDTENLISGYQIRKTCGDGSPEWIPPETTMSPGERSLTDLNVTSGESYDYTLYILLTTGGNTSSDPQTVHVVSVPAESYLGQNHPNPFNPGTTIPWALTEYSRVTIEVFDTAGRKVKTVLDDYRDRGYGSEEWDGLNDRGEPAPSGVYFYRLRAGGYTATRKMVLLR